MYRIVLVCTITALAFCVFLTNANATTYYVDSVGGNDGNAGTSSGAAWQTVTKINATTFSPGDELLFKAGSSWSGLLLWPKGSGVNGSPIVIDMYGDPNDGLPHIAGPTDGVTRPTFKLYNQEYWEINNLEITHYDPTNNTLRRHGIWIELNEPSLVGKQVLNHIYLRNLAIHNINGNPGDYNASAIYMAVYGDGTAANGAWFNDIRIEDCSIYDVNTAGFMNYSDFDGGPRTSTDDTGWVPWTNFVMRNNYFNKISGRALHTRVLDGGLVEYNIAHGNNYLDGEGEEANCFVLFNCDNCVWQYNEVYDHAKFFPEIDGGAFDIDYRSKDCIVQYNYSHNNGMFCAAPCNGGTGGFNLNPTFRYNISQNENHEVVHLSGPTDGAKIYNNTFYIGPGQSDVLIVWHKNWGGYADNTSYYNNIIYNLGTNSSYDLASSTNNTFDYNVFYGNHPASEPADAHKLTSDPNLVAAGTGGIGLNSVDGYKLIPGSACIDSGMTIAGNGGLDYWGNTVPYNILTDRGAHEWTPGDANDHTPPEPNQMTWASEPNAISDTEIEMTGTTAVDPNDNGVQYYFNNITDANHDSGWQMSSYYLDTVLDPNTEYSYQVKARDLSINLNETAWSVVRSATTTEDTNSPEPDPMTWQSVPAAQGVRAITMTATTATDLSGGVEYYFNNVTDANHDSDWQSGENYTDTDLESGKRYSYRVKARDVSANLNQTGWSSTLSAWTLDNVIIYPEADAFVRAGTYADDNYGGDTTLCVKTASVDYIRRSFLRFDLSGVTGTVTGATLRLYVDRRDAATTHAVDFVSTDTWSENSITWNNQPASGATLDSNSIPAAGNWIEFDVTSQVSTELAGDDKISLMVHEPAATTYTLYDSKETATASNKPQLVITKPLAGDFEPDDDVDGNDLQTFVGEWLNTCTDPGWCGGCDIDQSGRVDFADYLRLAANWMKIR